MGFHWENHQNSTHDALPACEASLVLLHQRDFLCSGTQEAPRGFKPLPGRQRAGFFPRAGCSHPELGAHHPIGCSSALPKVSCSTPFPPVVPAPLSRGLGRLLFCFWAAALLRLLLVNLLLPMLRTVVGGRQRDPRLRGDAAAAPDPELGSQHTSPWQKSARHHINPVL